MSIQPDRYCGRCNFFDIHRYTSTTNGTPELVGLTEITIEDSSNGSTGDIVVYKGLCREKCGLTLGILNGLTPCRHPDNAFTAKIEDPALAKPIIVYQR